MYFQNLHKQTFKRTLTRGDVAGSGAKMIPQKKSGRARQGDKRAPHLWKGGKAHGAKPMDYTYPLNEKVRLLGLKTLLSARLYEEKIILIDTEALEYGKTKFLNEIVAPFKQDKLIFLTPFEVDKNFENAAKNIKTISLVNPFELHLPSILKNDWIFATVKGLQQFESLIEDKEVNLYRNRKVPRERLPYDSIIYPAIRRAEKKHDHFSEDIMKVILEREQWEDEDKPLHLFTESLQGYVKEVKQL
jgi:large subunit ribosomal protein L4